MTAIPRTFLAAAFSLMATGAMAQDAAETPDDTAAADAPLCLAAGQSEEKCECQAEALADVFDTDEMVAIGEAATAEDYPAVTAAIGKGIGIDQNKNDAYNAAIESCASL